MTTLIYSCLCCVCPFAFLWLPCTLWRSITKCIRIEPSNSSITRFINYHHCKKSYIIVNLICLDVLNNLLEVLSKMPCLCECIPTLGQAIFTLVAFFGLKFAYGLYKCSKSSGKKTPKILKEDWKKDVVYLYQFPRPDYTAQLSPFCLKVEAFLRLHDIKHEVSWIDA